MEEIETGVIGYRVALCRSDGLCVSKPRMPRRDRERNVPADATQKVPFKFRLTLFRSPLSNMLPITSISQLNVSLPVLSALQRNLG